MSKNGEQLCGAIKRNGELCRNPAGHDTHHPGVGRCYFHEDPVIKKQYCYARKSKGRRCRLPAGYQTPHQGTGRCVYHEFSNSNRIWHQSKKLYQETCCCKSRYEKWTLINLDRDRKVVKYAYEPFPITYYFNGKQNEYKPDVLVQYSNGAKDLIEVKGIGEMNLSRLWDINLAKFEAANEYGKHNNMNFVLWVYNNGDLQIWSFEMFCVYIDLERKKTMTF